jgi:hypothetical protein
MDLAALDRPCDLFGEYDNCSAQRYKLKDESALQFGTIPVQYFDNSKRNSPLTLHISYNRHKPVNNIQV